LTGTPESPDGPRSFVAIVEENVELSAGTFVLRLAGCAPLDHARAGQFVMVRGEWGRDPLLPRAMSVMRAGGGRAELLIKVVGRGTRLLGRARRNDRVTVLGPLGRAFPPPSARRHVLVAGGVGLAPLLMWAEQAARDGLAAHATLCYGARTAADLVLLEDLRRTRLEVRLTTEDGTAGTQGRVTAALPLEGAPVLLACGPTPMLRALHALARERALECHLSVEEEMGCGVRVCLGCALPGTERPFVYACSDGPVLRAEEIRW
jgi:dihydroorotate dehydrogenase electron transfer subunit